MRAVAFIKEGDAGNEADSVARGQGFACLARVCTLLILSLAAATPALAETNTTFSLSQGGGEIGLLSTYRHGLINDLQIDSVPDARLIGPNITINKQWGNIGGWHFSSSHEINTPYLSLSNSPCQGACSLNTSTLAPELLNLNSQFYFRHRFARGVTVTPSIGVELNAGGLPATEISQMGMLFNPFHSGYSINTGIDVSGYFGNNWGYAADLEYFSIAGQANDPILGHKAMLFYEWDKHRRISLGYKYTNGLYNYQYDGAYPMLDILWSWE